MTMIVMTMVVTRSYATACVLVFCLCRFMSEACTVQ